MQLDTLTFSPDGSIRILDQTALPFACRHIELTTLEAAAHAIAAMQVRGAPLIGATAACAVALAMQQDASDKHLAHAIRLLAATRPTAVNLHWALARMTRILTPHPITQRAQRGWEEAQRIREEDIETNCAIAHHGLTVLNGTIAARPLSAQSPLNIMTHCNAGALACCGWGTALAPVYLAHAQDIPVHVWVSETRPRNQGLLSAYELAQAGIAHTLIADNAAGQLIAEGQVDIVIVGADRIAANGDTANKIGTYLKALAAHAHRVPFYVAAPRSTIDTACTSGREIPIEERASDEMRIVHGCDIASLAPHAIRIAQNTTATANPAFDVTPAELITGIITDAGVIAPQRLEQIIHPN